MTVATRPKRDLPRLPSDYIDICHRVTAAGLTPDQAATMLELTIAALGLLDEQWPEDLIARTRQVLHAIADDPLQSGSRKNFQK